MASCELCGRSEDSLCIALIEGVKFKVCSNCKGFGRIIEQAIVKKAEPKPIKRENISEDIVPDFPEKIKTSREYKGMTQKELAFRLNEKEAVISKLEQGAMKPGIDLARKLEKALGLTLVVKEEILETLTLNQNIQSFTIGHFIKKNP